MCNSPPPKSNSRTDDDIPEPPAHGEEGPMDEPKKTSVGDFKRGEDMMQDLLMERLNLPVGETEDWALSQVNVEDTAVKSLEDEFKRLQVLKSYNVTGR